MRSSIRILLVLLLPSFTVAQNPIYNTPSRLQADGMMLVLKKAPNDSLRMLIYAELSPYYFDKNIDSSIYYGQQALIIAKKLRLKLWQAFISNSIGYSSYQRGNYITALKLLLEALNISGDENSEQNIWHISAFYDTPDPHKARLNVLAYSLLNLAFVYTISGNTAQQESNYLEGVKIGESINDHAILGIFKMNLAHFYQQLNKLDSGLITAQSALDNLNSTGLLRYQGVVLSNIGDIYTAKGKYDSAEAYYRKGIQLNTKQDLQRGILLNYKSIAKLFRITGNTDSAIYYAKTAIQLAKKLNATANLSDVYNTLSATYKMRNENDSAYFYLKTAVALQDSFYNKQKITQFQDIGFNEQLHKHEVENQKIQYQNKIRTYAMLTGIGVFMVIAFLLYKNNRNRKKANVLLHQQKEELQSTLSELKSTQSQLIQSEKMASLGELTAGIAHEIQNPLNFVNNFSEVNSELIKEMKQEIDNGNMEEVKTIADNIDENEQKIMHHGKRADAIVKGMLQHSRSSSGVKELTDINALADEYLRLSYHGLRAKDKFFNAITKTDFDISIGKINIVPQDIGRVLLNLFNNAFYAVTEKAKQQPNGLPAGQAGYEPTISVSTKKVNNTVELTVKDNGNGIPQKVIDKIFQPFFTTKPTGEGTGLGLSLSYDIVKAHGGGIKVETKEGEGAEFIIQLPII
jgi:two-component system NtrC family sensor kinase